MRAAQIKEGKMVKEDRNNWKKESVRLQEEKQLAKPVLGASILTFNQI